MYYKGTYTITAPVGHYAQTWQCRLELEGVMVHGYGYTVRGSVFNANRKMDKALKFQREHEKYAGILREVIRDKTHDSN